jgi:glycosyltransferase A (GT-A) superfamily protein (DUF2064 family)
MYSTPNPFSANTRRVIKKVKGLRKRGIQWSMKERLKDLDLVDDICLLAQRFCDMEEKLKILKEEAELVCRLT